MSAPPLLLGGAGRREISIGLEEYNQSIAFHSDKESVYDLSQLLNHFISNFFGYSTWNFLIINHVDQISYMLC